MRGRIHRISANQHFVHAEGGVYSCRYRGKLKQERQNVLRLAAVGDEVDFAASGAGEGIIEKVIPRRSKLSRHDAFRPRYEQVIAANVDLLVIVHSASNPELSLLTIDKCTVMGQANRLPSIVVVNKTDLGDVRDAVAHYSRLGFPLVFACAERGEGIEELRAQMRRNTSVFLGPSGVGKTSLLNALRGDSGLKVGEVSPRTGEGRHTTTWVELLEFEPNTWAIDTPGLEFFTLWGVSIENLAEHFPDLAERAPRCKFRMSCSHTQEPGCEVARGLEDGSVVRARYESYVKIREDLIKKRRELG